MTDAFRVSDDLNQIQTTETGFQYKLHDQNDGFWGLDRFETSYGPVLLTSSTVNDHLGDNTLGEVIEDFASGVYGGEPKTDMSIPNLTEGEFDAASDLYDALSSTSRGIEDYDFLLSADKCRDISNGHAPENIRVAVNLFTPERHKAVVAQFKKHYFGDIFENQPQASPEAPKP